MPRVFIHPFAVPADAIDVFGHVNNLEYLRWMQDAATAHSEAQGWTLARYLELGAGWFVRSHSIQYLRPAYAGDPIALLTWVSGFDRRTSPRKYLFWRRSDRKVLAQAETLWAFVDFRTGRGVAIPPEVEAAFEVVPADEDVLRAVRTEPAEA
jgi:acyl-CoA thioester hydrolase